MPKPVRVDPEAEAEIADAIAFYEARRPGLGDEFLEEIDAAIATLEQPGPECGPAIGVPAELNVRRKLCWRFPYSIVFVELPASVRVIAVVHGRQRPGYWRRRM